ncbi:3-hydroxyacyl-CoA dehydrogenase NAD-binding domain-containing protein [Thalassovita sp.]|uniref:3-hydroxyacyl-CoA dehydrogenase NAD-binding domain-containing protein n=1 Tax=Thalassovita sp. TaxID=1979401 RepID=UPI0029DE51A5|nr:3-hydroxyacyl-CoA dehydrogenase NAD-binding domain-containing protein [Thalassovita sp.]
MTKPFSIAVLGGGLIGASWAALFLAYGHNVRIADPDPETKDRCMEFIVRAWPHLQELVPELLRDAPLHRLAVVTEISAACAGVDFVQECGPDRIDAKRTIVSQAESILSSDVIIASSTSSLLASDIQTGARHPERILVAHPMNPPHLLPLVELVAGRATTPEALRKADAFYQSLNRVTICVQKERPGHLANRLTAALYREAVNIVAEGIASVADVDRAIAYGPGMRWGLMGPHMIYHLGGGQGGYRRYLEHLGPTQEARWQDLGHPALTADLIEKLVAGLEQELQGHDVPSLESARDEALVALTKIKQTLPF